MEYSEERNLIISYGKQMAAMGLIRRTWGNISARVNSGVVLITPSGLGYEYLKDDDIVIYNPLSKKFDGKRKPSSEKGVHLSAYQVFDDVNFVIHTHQEYATILGLFELDYSLFSEDEINELGGISVAKYGISSTKKLAKNVKKEFLKGNHTVLMAHHGVVFAAKTADEAMKRALLLEEIAKRIVKVSLNKNKQIDFDLTELKSIFPYLENDNDEEVVQISNKDLFPSIDDFAQMAGSRVKSYSPLALKEIKKELANHPILLINGYGALINIPIKSDSDALRYLLKKEAKSHIIADEKSLNIAISHFDAKFMNWFYIKKYAKRIKG